MDKNAFLAPRLPEHDVEIPGVGVVRVRALTRAEAVAVRKVKGDLSVMERKILLLGLVDPSLSSAEIDQWYEAASAGEIGLIVDKIGEISGLFEGAPKSGVHGDGEEP